MLGVKGVMAVNKIQLAVEGYKKGATKAKFLKLLFAPFVVPAIQESIVVIRRASNEKRHREPTDDQKPRPRGVPSHLNPLPGFRRFHRRIGDRLDERAITETRYARTPSPDGIHKLPSLIVPKSNQRIADVGIAR